MYGTVREALLMVRDVSKGPPEGPGKVGRPSRWSGTSLKALPEV